MIVLPMLLMTTNLKASTDYKPDANAPRSNVPNIYKWDISPLFRSDSEWDSAYNNVRAQISGLSIHKGKLNSAPSIKACLDDFVKINQLFDKITLYANLKTVENENNEKYQVLHQKAISLAKHFNEQSAFIRDEILRLSDQASTAIMNDPMLGEYKEYIKELWRRKASLLGTEAEKVLTLAGDNLWAQVDLNEIPSDVEMVFKAITRDIQLPIIKDEDGKDVQLTLNNYSKYRSSKDRRVRKETVEAFFGALKKYQNIFAATLSGEVKRDVFLSRVRHYKHAVSAYLDREDIDPAVIDNLITTVHKNLTPLHRYISLRKKILKLPDIHIYDLYTPLVPSVESDIPYRDAVRDVIEALKPLGDKYLEVLTKAIQPEAGWTDVYPNKGKESGAFSTSIWRTHPYVKLNYMNSIDDASTLAHEFGHAMHSYLNMEANSYLTSGYSTLTAEIASTLNEMLFSRYMIEKYKNDDKMRLYLLGEQLETIRTTVYRQTLFAEFEKKLHEIAEKGEPLTAELFNKIYGDLLKKYYGSELILDKNDDIEWSYIPHLYWKFYVYSYAAGLSSGIAIADNILKGAPENRDRYLAMLKSPGTEKPVEVIRKAGVDITKPQAIEAATNRMNEIMDEMEKILAKSKH